MERMVPDSFHDRWDGPHWRWWSLVAGIALSALAVAVAVVFAELLEENAKPLAFLFVTVIVLLLSIIGSGMFDGLAGRAISGGLARQPAKDVRAERPAPNETEQARRDRRTIRCGLAALPALVVFVGLLFA